MQSYPFTSQVTFDEHGLPKYDRAVDSAFLRKVFAAYFSDGIFYKPTNALQVVAGTGMQVQIKPGIFHIQGAMGIETELRTLSLTTAGSQPRIDTVVGRLDLSKEVRSIDLYIKTGTPASSPSAPALTRDSTIWELGLANIYVGSNVSTISQSNITDTRLDTSRCGMVVQTIGSLDTSAFFAQLQQAMAENKSEAERLIQYLQQQIDAVEGDTAWMLKSVYDSEGQNRDVFQAMGHLYKATLLADGWKSGSGKYTQTAALTPMTGGPAVAANSILTSAVMCEQTTVEATNETLQEVLGIINTGTTTLAANQVTVTVFEAPAADVEAIWQIKQGVDG